MLVPMTSSMYVRGATAPMEGVLVDVGTGYYIEKSIEEARRAVPFPPSHPPSHPPSLLFHRPPRPLPSHPSTPIQAQLQTNAPPPRRPPCLQAAAFLQRKITLIDSQAINVQKTAAIKQQNLQGTLNVMNQKMMASTSVSAE